MLLLTGLLLWISGCRHKKVALEPAKKPAPVVTKKPVEHPAGNISEFRQKLRLSEKDIHQNKLYSFCEDWYGVPYKYGGCNKKGVDCSCFISLLYQEVYSKTLARSANDMFKMCDEISIEDARQGDLVFFKIGSNLVTHVGVYISGSWFIHSSTSKGVMLNSLQEAYYKKYFFCAGKIKRV